MPRKKGPETISWSIRIKPEELELWKRAAELKPTAASYLVREAANREAHRIIAHHTEPKRKK
jgi:uncharacterized protein (DUF1778 family)